MRVADLWPAITWPGGDSSTLLRDVDKFSEEDWGTLIGTLGDMAHAYAEAEAKATEEWARRFPRTAAMA